MTESPHWFKSSYSNNGGACVEVATNLVTSQRIIPVRDSKSPEGPQLAVSDEAFAFFLQGVKTNEL